MSETDSFIEEVTEEVRRDRLFGLMRRYGWIAVLAVLLLVGGAAYNEWSKAKTRAQAEATGDAMIAALRDNDPLKRAVALGELDSESPGARAVAVMLAAGEQVTTGDFDLAAKALQTLVDDGELPLVYRQVAGFKRLMILGSDLSVEDRRKGYEALIGPGSQLRLLAEEQLALIDIETGETKAAAERLQAIISDAEATPGLRQRASQLMVAMGVEPELIPGTQGEADQ
ncbi:tetratricopeptide repeat protein [Alisedimentitalea sp. MJ-SS2]|uniref:tetratricopeptide repeat protein n=1 Tax=Aliisedimentitalea sp. MJ-SS2 TaxID=3049795 RepID=UPI00291367B8|nr:tetratricopeptide repeat protein [Alisedimentitalea sp. MJ-SS2]MDU8926399.1 tetratricopeptide repeat protein [Alisedimentitalea sp. MJ-SS2]